MQEVVLVDDDATFTHTLGVLLARAGYAVVPELSYASARQYLSTHTPDVLITDLRLGDKSGWNLVRYVRLHQPALPIIIVSGYNSALEDRDARRLGISVLAKPFDPDDLVTLLRELAEEPE